MSGRSLVDMDSNRTRFHRRTAAPAADLPPARSGDARHTTVPGEPQGAATGAGWPPRSDTGDNSNPARLAQDKPPATWATGAV